MKTLNIIITLSLILITSMNSFATSINLQNEQYIDDIPFNTKAIFDSIQNDQNLDSIIALQDEAYIADIPFDTEEVVAQYRCDSAMKVKFELPEEEAINDIPFNTLYIMSNVLFRNYDRMPLVFVSIKR